VIIEANFIDVELEVSGRAVGAKFQNPGVFAGVGGGKPRRWQANALPCGVRDKSESGCGEGQIGWRDFDLEKTSIAAHFKLHAA
jgi:hypothetical protein